MWRPTPIEKTICLHPAVEKTLAEWIEKPTHPAVLLYGEPGVGKTTLAHRVYRDAKLKPIEFNASHTRSGTSFRKILLPLLNEGGVVHMIETGKRGGIGIILDEIDGLSQGEKGGLKELLDFLRSWSPEKETTPIILISNTLDSRNLIQISKLCITIEMREADKECVEKWLGRELGAENHLQMVHGDLRVLQRQLIGLEQAQEIIEVPEGILPISWWSLWNEWDPFFDLDIDSHEANLAGLVFVENLNDRISAVKGNTHESWNTFMRIFSGYSRSDRADFWAFFHQCWNLLPLSQHIKLKIPSLLLSQSAPLPEDPEGLIPKVDSLRYTPVLTKQSAMFNSWKFLCEISDPAGIPIRLVPSLCHIEADKPGQKPDKQRRLRNIALQSLLPPAP
jgi:GTPase SAR1 family protein